MKKIREKDRTILSLTPREVDELESIIFYADSYWNCYPITSGDDAAEIKENKEFVASLRKWCKAFGLKSKACLVDEDW